MAASKVICSFVQRQVGVVTVVEASRNPPLPSQVTNNQVLVSFSFVPLPQDHVQPRKNKKTFQPPPFLGCAPQFHQGEPSFKSLPLPTMLGQEILSSLQLLLANLCVQKANDLLNNVYPMVQQQNSQALEKRLFFNEESLHHASLRNNTI